MLNRTANIIHFIKAIRQSKFIMAFFNRIHNCIEPQVKVIGITLLQTAVPNLYKFGTTAKSQFPGENVE